MLLMVLAMVVQQCSAELHAGGGTCSGRPPPLTSAGRRVKSSGTCMPVAWPASISVTHLPTALRASATCGGPVENCQELNDRYFEQQRKTNVGVSKIFLNLKTDDATTWPNQQQLPAAKPCATVTKDGLCCNPGALNVGPMLHVANLTLKAAAAWCNTSLACAGFTAKVNPNKTKSITQQCTDTGADTIFQVYFKTMLGGNADPLWSTWRKIAHTAPVYYCHKRHCRLCDVPGATRECVANVSYTQPDCFGQCNDTLIQR